MACATLPVTTPFHSAPISAENWGDVAGGSVPVCGSVPGPVVVVAGGAELEAYFAQPDRKSVV
jgi:hypothetical protein